MSVPCRGAAQERGGFCGWKSLVLWSVTARCAHCELGSNWSIEGGSVLASQLRQEVVSIPRSNLSSIRLKDPKIFHGIMD